MAKISRQALPRGTRLTVEEVYSLGLSKVSQLTSGQVGADNLVAPSTPWKMTFVIPVLDSQLWYRVDATYPLYTFGIPFTLPVTQEEFSNVFKTEDSVLTLDEIVVSFDQKDEPLAFEAGRYDQWGAACITGCAVDAGGKLSCRISLNEKTPSLTTYTLDRSIYDYTIPSIAFEAGINPITLPIPSARLLRYKTYLLGIQFPNIYDVGTATYYQAPSFTITLTGRTTVLPRDTWTTVNFPEVMNAPKSYENPITASVVISNPASPGVINASGSGGIQTALEVLDIKSLDGGMTREGMAKATEHLAVSAAYEVIAVPMFQSLWAKGHVAAIEYDLSRAPYINAGRTLIADRRIITLDRPFILHHAFAVRSGSALDRAAAPASGKGRWPTSAGLTDYIGVGIGAGIRSNFVGYQQAAYVAITPANKAAYTIDRLVAGVADNPLAVWPSYNTSGWDYELLSIPIPAAGGYTGTGWMTQGYPIFAGTGDSTTMDRTRAVHGGAWGASKTEGCENFLEVRWTIQEPAGLVFGVGGAGSVDEVYVGMAGAWIILVGKSPLAQV